MCCLIYFPPGFELYRVGIKLSEFCIWFLFNIMLLRFIPVNIVKELVHRAYVFMRTCEHIQIHKNIKIYKNKNYIL